MDRSGIGIGSTSLVLIFTVLCLALFAFISYTAAENDMALAQAEAALTMEYYEADALSERVAAGLLASETIPVSLYGVEITSEWNATESAQIAEYYCKVSDRKELYARISIKDDDYEVLVWRMRDTDRWRPDASWPVWSGE